MKKKLLLLVAAILLTSCAATNNLLIPSEQMVNGPLKDLKTKYIPNDPTLSEADKKLRLDAIKSYEELVAAEKARLSK